MLKFKKKVRRLKVNTAVTPLTDQSLILPSDDVIVTRVFICLFMESKKKKNPMSVLTTEIRSALNPSVNSLTNQFVPLHCDCHSHHNSYMYMLDCSGQFNDVCQCRSENAPGLWQGWPTRRDFGNSGLAGGAGWGSA